MPAGVTPSDLKRILTVIDQFLETPYDTQGRQISELLSKRRRRRRQRHSSPDSDPPDDHDKPSKKREKKMKEKEQYKSATLIEDSDAEYGDIEAFLEKEKELRARMSRAAAASGKIGTMKATGTKKRRKKGDQGREKKRKGNDASILLGSDKEDLDDFEESDIEVFASRGSSPTSDHDHTLDRTKSRPRPRPRPRLKPRTSASVSPPVQETPNVASDVDDVTVDRVLPKVDGAPGDLEEGSPSPGPARISQRKNRLVISDEE